MLQKELEVEERIVEAARRMAELSTGNRRERQKRKQSLQELVIIINASLALQLSIACPTIQLTGRGGGLHALLSSLREGVGV
jgi:hypothetical protein